MQQLINQGKNTNVLAKLSYFLVKEHRFLKLIFFSFASYLILEELYTFLVVKPTYTSIVKRNITAEDFPNIILCPEPGIDLTVAISKGYYGAFTYFLGSDSIIGLGQIGWGGNNSEDVKEVFQNISILKTEEDCPMQYNSYFWYKGNLSRPYQEPMKFALTKALYPNHVCCKVEPPEFSSVYPVIGMQMTLSGETLYNVFMADKMTASYFDQHKKVMMGDKIVSDRHNTIIYKVQIKEDEKIQDDPKYPCIDYKIRGEYAKCLENEILKQNLEFLNCTPPWMTSNESIWCKGKYEFKVDYELFEYRLFLGLISVSEASSGKCLVPCKLKRYWSKEIGVQKGLKNRGIMIWFEKEVEITATALTIDAQTLISSIGGFIGIGKNLLWIMILVMSGLGFLINNFNQT